MILQSNKFPIARRLQVSARLENLQFIAPGLTADRAGPDLSAMTQPDSRTPWRLILPIGLAYGLIMSAQVHLSSTMGGRPIGWVKSFALQMPIAAAWMLFAPVILGLGRRFPMIGKGWLRHVALHWRCRSASSSSSTSCSPGSPPSCSGRPIAIC